MRKNNAELILKNLIIEKLNQEKMIRIKYNDCYDFMIIELDKIERFSPIYKTELMSLSKCIRKYLWRGYNTAQLYNLIKKLNLLFEILADMIGPDAYWNLENIINYVILLYQNGIIFGITDDFIYNKIIDEIQTSGAKDIIAKQWDDILSEKDGNKAFIEVFDDLFENAITKYESEFIHTMKNTDILYRMVKETNCDMGRFIPWPNKVQNRWNPPGKTYLYLSYGKEDIDYNEELKLGQYICLLECKLESEADVCFCKFNPTSSGRILNLAYDDVELFEIRDDMNKKVNIYINNLLEKLLLDKNLLKYKYDKEYIKNKIRSEMNENLIEQDIVEKNGAKQILKLICSCIYKKINCKDEKELERQYKSFQILAKYLERKGITGIIYPCTRTSKIKGKNLVLFNIKDAEPISGSIKKYHFNGNYD